MAYTLTPANARWLRLGGVPALRLDVAVSGTHDYGAAGAEADVDLDISSYLTAGKDKDGNAVYPAPAFVTIQKYERATADGEVKLEAFWDRANDDTANGYVGVTLSAYTDTDNVFAGMDFQVLVMFEDLAAGVDNGKVTTS